MTIYVDELEFRGMKYRGNDVRSCHMMTDGDIQELHDMATRIGMRKWFQEHENHPHYDLMKSKRELAISYGAVEVGSIEMIYKCDKRYRELIENLKELPEVDVKPNQ